MKYNIKTERTLETDNKKNFIIGQDIAFKLFNTETNYHDRYIGEITEITDETITIADIEVNRNHINGTKVISLGDIESNSCNYVYCD